MYSARFSPCVPISPRAPGRPALGRVGPPGGLLAPRLLGRRGEPALRVLHDDLAQLPQLAGAHDVPRQLHHRIAGVVVHQAEDLSGARHERLQFAGFRRRERHRLLAHDMKPRLQEGSCHGEVGVVRGDDRDEVRPLPLGVRAFSFDQLLKAPVHAPRIEEQPPARLAGLLRIAAEHPGHDVDPAIHPRRLEMHLADERARATPHHSHIERSIQVHDSSRCRCSAALRAW